MITGSDDKTLRLWDLKDGSLLKTMEGHTSHILTVAVSRDGELIASGDEKGKLAYDVFVKDTKQKDIKSQSLALDVPVVVNENIENSVVQAFEPTNATPEPVAREKRGV